MNTLRLCIVGFGNASREFCRVLVEKDEWIKANYNTSVLVTSISTRSKGALINYDGIDLKKALKDVEAFGKFDNNSKDFSKLDTLSLIAESRADVMVELSTLSIYDGQPAITHIETAFKNNMNVITANKGPIAWDYARLKSLANIKKLKFLYETTVMDGTPIFNLVKYTLPGCNILGFKGILNSTTNFVLEEMESGSSYEAAIKEAQRRGFAEANPSLDIDGWDAAAKTCALANVLMNANLTPMKIDRKGIGDITLGDVLKAKSQGKKIKLLSEAYIENGKIIAKVYPSLFNPNEVFYTIDSTTSMLQIKTDLMGELAIIEKAPEILQTAYGIYSDMLNLIRELELI